MVMSELDFTTANEERRFFGECGGFNFDVSLSPIRFEGENIETKAVSLAYRNMVDFICKFLLSKFI